jgi:tRNA threonylcarbamoyl adenosine modification protein YeaZ
MILLAIDCAASLCAACVYDQATGKTLGREVRDIGKGHAEQLMDVIARTLAAAGKTYADLDRIAVSVGPGSFTGVRVGVSTARGLALALKIAAVGVTTLEAIAAEAVAMAQKAGQTAPERVLAAIDGGRDGIYVGVYDRFGSMQYDPVIMTPEEAAGLASREKLALAGSAAGKIAGLTAEAELTEVVGATADIAVYARLAAGRPAPTERPKPLYLRAPDAKPQAGFVLPRRSP